MDGKKKTEVCLDINRPSHGRTKQSSPARLFKLNPFHNASCICDRIRYGRRVGWRVARDGSQLSCGENRSTNSNDGGFSRLIHEEKISYSLFIRH
jgi:hypothetical protein